MQVLCVSALPVHAGVFSYNHVVPVWGDTQGGDDRLDCLKSGDNRYRAGMVHLQHPQRGGLHEGSASNKRPVAISSSRTTLAQAGVPQ